MIVACVPARNEEGTIASVLAKAKPYVDKIIVCDDGSTDLTGKISEAMGAEVIRNPKPGGYGSALARLFRRAMELNPEVMVTLDADGQHDADQIPKLTEPIFKGEADVVIGSRFNSHSERQLMRRYRKFGIKTITDLTSAASGLAITDAQSGFRAYGRTAMQHVSPAELGMGASVEILMKIAEQKLRIKEVPIAAVNVPSDRNALYHGLDVVASLIKFVSIRHPLLFYGISGIVTALSGVLYGLYIIPSYATQGKPVTNVALLTEAIVTSGLLLMFMAVILFTVSNIVRESR